MFFGPDYRKAAESVKGALKGHPGAEAAAFLDSPEAVECYSKLDRILVPSGIALRAVTTNEGLLNRYGVDGVVLEHPALSGDEVTSDLIELFRTRYREWYLLDGDDPTLIDGMSLGYIHEINVFGLIKDLVWRLENIRLAVRSLQPRILVTFVPDGGRSAGMERFLAGDGNTLVINMDPATAGSRLKRIEKAVRLSYPGWLAGFAAAMLRRAGKKIPAAAQSDTARHLFVYTGYSTSSIDSISLVKKEYGEEQTLHLAEGKATGRELSARGIPHIFYEDIQGPGAAVEVFRRRRGVLKAWRRAHRVIGGDGRFDYHGLDIYPLLLTGLDEMVKKGVNAHIARRWALDRLMEDRRVCSVLVATDFHTVTREAVMAARARGVMTVEVVHGLATTPLMYVPATADYLAVWGDEMKTWFVKHGVEPERLVVTGQPRYDGFGELKADATSIKASLGIAEGSKVVMYAGTGVPGEAETVSMALRALGGREDLVFIIRPHPREKMQAYEKLAGATARPRAILVPEKNIFELLAACDIVLITCSTVGFEAVLMDKPLVVVADIGGRAEGNYIRGGVAVRTHGPDELRETVEGILAGSDKFKSLKENRAGYIYRYNYRNDGRASFRVARLLERACAESTGRPAA